MTSKLIFYFSLFALPILSIANTLEYLLESNRDNLSSGGSFIVKQNDDFFFVYKAKSEDEIAAEGEYLNNLNDALTAEMIKYCNRLGLSLDEEYDLDFNLKKHSFFDDGHIFISQINWSQIQEIYTCH